jgi:hypothetical protein
MARPTPVPDATVLAAAAAYARWADARKLRPIKRRGDAFRGAFHGRDVAFTTGLAGSAPLSPDLVVAVDLALDAPVLFRRDDEPTGPCAAVPRAAFASTARLRAVGLTRHDVRLTFDKLAPSDALDTALEALDDVLRDLAAARAPADPYRG